MCVEQISLRKFPTPLKLRFAVATAARAAFHFSTFEVNFAGRMWKLGGIAICRNLRFQFQLNLGMASEKGRMHKVTRKDVIFSFPNLKCWIKFSTFYRLPGWLKILGFQILPVSNCQHLPNPFPASIVKILTFHCKRTYESNSWRIWFSWKSLDWTGAKPTQILIDTIVDNLSIWISFPYFQFKGSHSLILEFGLSCFYLELFVSQREI